MLKCTANEMMMWGLSNLWKEGEEGGYMVRHGRQPVSDFSRPRGGDCSEDGKENRPNYFERAFPCFFPYGVGGLEADRPVGVDFRDHVKWALDYHDSRFGRHETFPFVVFGILQRRQVLFSARLQMRRKTFDTDARLLSTITLEKLEKARQEEEKNLPISDPAVCSLRKHIHATGGRVMGSDQVRYQLRSQIWSTSIYLNPPSFWMTINPCDLHDPIAQVFCGEEVDMNNFMASLGPSRKKRAQNIAADPYATAKFFNFVMKTIMITLFRVEVTNFKVNANMGILGRVQAYFGVVESQNRGSLHLHLLVWLMGAPTSAEMHELLRQAEFRSRILTDIQANVRAFIPGVTSKDEVKSIPNETDIAYCRPIHPDTIDFDIQRSEFECRLARAKQLHTCEVWRCLIPDKHGHFKCKRRAPFEKSEDDFIDESGKWGPKRLYEYFNAWNPPILLMCRCNNDIKLITNGPETRASSCYITGYATKKQNKHHNLSGIMAKGFAYHVENADYLDNIRERQRLLFFSFR